MTALAITLLWLLFLPNAPYLLTALIHLRAMEPVPLCYDLILLLDFALLGLFLAFVSLRLMHSLVDDHLGAIAGWSFVTIVSGLCGLGVFIGRFLRCNSWDLFARPSALAASIAGNFNEPRTMAASSLLALFLLLTYLFFWLVADWDAGLKETNSNSSRFESIHRLTKPKEFTGMS